MDQSRQRLRSLGYVVTQTRGGVLQFKHEGKTIRYFMHKQWATGKTIQDGKGLDNLLRQLPNILTVISISQAIDIGAMCPDCGIQFGSTKGKYRKCKACKD